MDPNLRIDTTEHEGVGTIRLVGSAGAAELETLERAVKEILVQAPAKLIIDVGGLDYIASVGLGQLLMLARHIKSGGGHAVFACPPGEILGVLEASRVNQLAPIAESVDSALALV